MGCVESHLRSGKTRLAEAQDDVSRTTTEPCDQIEQWTKLLTSRSLVIDFRDADNRTFYEESNFIAECLRLHNLYRNNHLAPPLRLSPTLCHSAQSWANLLAHSGLFFHHNMPDVGENIFCRWNYLQADLDLTGKEVVDCWYRGNGHYRYELQPNMLHVNAGAFTQMVWIGTEEIGLGKARSREGKYVVVANYRPAGNVPGQFHENVARAVVRRDSQGDQLTDRRLPSTSTIKADNWKRTYYASARRKASAVDSSSRLELGCQVRSRSRRHVYIVPQ